jgi:flagellin-like protein
MKSFKRSVKALSPVVASIILIAVTVAVSIAVAVWMGALSTGFMQTEQLTITSATFIPGTTEYINYTMSNTGTTGVKIDQVWLNGQQIGAVNVNYALSDGTAILDSTIPANAKGCTLQFAPTGGWNTGDTYQVKLVSAKGTTFLYNAVGA